MNTLPTEKRLAVIAAIVEGNGIRSTESMTDVHRDTIMRPVVSTGENRIALMHTWIRQVRVTRLEFDEIWTYVAKKQKRVRQEDPPEFGDQFVFVAIDPESKLVPSFAVGKRSPETTWQLVSDVRERTVGRVQVTTDGFRPDIPAVDDAFGADVDYAVLVKSYAAGSGEPGSYHPPTIAGIFHQIVFGRPDPLHICTSYVERQNLTMRMMMRRFTRLTNAFSKKLANLRAAVALYFAHYNFVRVHQTLRCTPAMQAGITDHVWGLEDILRWEHS